MEKKPMFYGGKVGPWIPVLLMLAGMLASTIIGGGGLNRLTGICSLFISRNTCPAVGCCCSSVTAANISSAYFGIPPTLQMQE